MPKQQRFFLLASMSGQTAEGKPFDGMAAGTFYDMWGREASIDRADFSTFLANTRALIESTRGESGQVVGLPIDCYSHDLNCGAGWITAVELSEDGSKIRFTPRWTDDGMELIASDKVRFFSPSLNLVDKVILGGSLTNWPATRTPTEIKLRPIELSEGLNELDIEEDADALTLLESAFENVKRLFSGRRPGSVGNPPKTNPNQEEPMTDNHQSLEALLSADPARVAELQALVETRAKAQVTELLEAEKRKAHVAEFSARVVSGSAERPVGLPVTQERLSKFMSSLSTEQQAEFEGLIEDVLTAGKLTEFSELGHSKDLGGKGRQKLPAPIAAQLQAWVDAKQSIEEFFRVNAVELGNQADYDLTAFEAKK